MKNEKETAAEEKQPKKAKQKKKGKVAQVYALHQKGASVKEIAEKMQLKETVIRSYIWRMQNPEKYRELLARYFRKRKLRKENDEIKLAVKNSKTDEKKEAQ